MVIFDLEDGQERREYAVHRYPGIFDSHTHLALGIVSHFRELSPEGPAFDSKRVCIKIPSTWEGLRACRELEKQGISTLATTVFCMEQAVLAADSGCAYIAPYVNELRVHFDPR